MDKKEYLTELLKYHEGFSGGPYKCPAGRTTIGYGRNLDARPLTKEEGAYLLGNDVRDTVKMLTLALPWVEQLDDVRWAVLVDMAYNLGIRGLLTFQNTLRRVQEGKYKSAAALMLLSKWARQVGYRAIRLSKMMATGEWPPEIIAIS